MKKLILLLTCFIMSQPLLAQKYYPQPALHKFEGVWKYADSGQVFKVVLSVNRIYLEDFNTEIDKLNGRYMYKKDNKIVVNTLDSSRFFIKCGPFVDSDKSLNWIRFFYTNPSTTKLADGFLKLIPEKNILLWTLINYQSQIKNNKGISVPKKIILHRVKE